MQLQIHDLHSFLFFEVMIRAKSYGWKALAETFNLAKGHRRSETNAQVLAGSHGRADVQWQRQGCGLQVTRRPSGERTAGKGRRNIAVMRAKARWLCVSGNFKTNTHKHTEGHGALSRERKPYCHLIIGRNWFGAAAVTEQRAISAGDRARTSLTFQRVHTLQAVVLLRQ